MDGSVDQASFSAVSGGNLVVSTEGVHQYDDDAALSLSLMALAVDGDETGGFDYRGVAIRDHADLERERARVAREVAESCIGNLGARAGRSYQGPVLFAPGALRARSSSPSSGAPPRSRSSGAGARSRVSWGNRWRPA